MRMRRRGGARRERLAVAAIDPFPGILALCRGDFDRVWIFGSPAAEGPDQVYFVVALFVFGGRDRDWVADVPVFAVR